MGRLSGFRYREVIRKLKKSGFQFDRQAAGSHEIWFNAETDRYLTIPNHSGDLLKALCAQYCARQESKWTSFFHAERSRRETEPGRVAALDTWLGYHPNLEAEIHPQVETITTEMDRILAF